MKKKTLKMSNLKELLFCKNFIIPLLSYFRENKLCANA